MSYDAKSQLIAVLRAEPRRTFSATELAEQSALPQDVVLAAAEQLISEGELARNGDLYFLNRRRRGLPSEAFDPAQDRRAG